METGHELMYKTFGDLTVLRYLGKTNTGENYYRCECDCGNEVDVLESTLFSDDDRFKNCGKCNLPIINKAIETSKAKARKSAEDMVGHKYNLLTVLNIDRIEQTEDNREHYYMHCLCDCGRDCIVEKNDLLRLQRKSCGRHGATKDDPKDFVGSFNSMKSRCDDINDPNYGGRGITYDSRWKFFANFKDDMYEKYLRFKENHPGGEKPTLDRRDVNGNYCKENCDFATYKEQANNKTNSVRYLYPEYNNAYHTASEFRDLLCDPGIEQESFRKSIKKHCKTIDGKLVITNPIVFRNVYFRNRMNLRAPIRINYKLTEVDYSKIELPKSFNMRPNKKEEE